MPDQCDTLEGQKVGHTAVPAILAIHSKLV